jgi:anaerobic selenocysteine-containing dehydrogenase
MDEAAHFALILNTWLTNEELYLVKKLFVENFLLEKIYFVDPTQGKADDILLTSERTPNRRGALEIGFDLKPPDWSQVSEDTDMLLIFGNFLTDQTNSEEIKAHLDKIKNKFLLTPHSSDFNDLMDVVLPTSVIPEKSGSITNVDGIVQEFSPALEGIGESRPEWKILIDLAKLANADFGFKTLTSPAVILEEMGKDIAFFKKI